MDTNMLNAAVLLLTFVLYMSEVVNETTKMWRSCDVSTSAEIEQLAQSKLTAIDNRTENLESYQRNNLAHEPS